jgi:hypothetical protein
MEVLARKAGPFRTASTKDGEKTTPVDLITCGVYLSLRTAEGQRLFTSFTSRVMAFRLIIVNTIALWNVTPFLTLI